MSNLHSEIADDNIHVAKGHSGASNGNAMWKDERGLQSWDARNILPPVIGFVPSNVAPPTEVDGDIYIIGSERQQLVVSTINWQSVNTVRYVFSGSPDLSTYSIGDFINVLSAVNNFNNGSFAITAVNDGSDYIEVSNVLIEDATYDETTGGLVTSTLADWDGCVQNSWVRYNSIDDLWYGVLPVNGVQALDEGVDEFLLFDGLNWDYQGIIRRFKVIIPTADVLTSYSTPVLLIAAPSSGIAEVLTAFMSTVFATTIYDTNVDGEIITDTGSVPQLYIPSGLATPNSSSFKFQEVSANPSVGGTGQLIAQKGIYFKTSGGNPANGDSDITIYGTYRIAK